MKLLNVILCIALIVQQNWSFVASQAARTALVPPKVKPVENSPQESALGSLYWKSRQSRCVRCYDTRRPAEEYSRYPSDYSSRMPEDRGSWYYPRYDRYEDRSRAGGRDYDRDDRYAPRTPDRYEGRGYEGRGYEGRGYEPRGYEPRGYEPRGYEARGYEGRGYDRYDDRGSEYDRGYDSRGAGYERRGAGYESRGTGYESRDRYASDYYRDRPYDRSRGASGGSSGYEPDRDYYDRYSTRYDYRNYRPLDETYRGQSGFDNSGRGYYFAGEQKDKQYLPKDGERAQPCVPCGQPNKVSSQPIDTGSRGYPSSPTSDTRGGGQYPYGVSNQSGWTNKKESANENRTPVRDEANSAYSGRRPRPLGGSYLFDRDNNVVTDAKANASAADSANKSGEKSASVNENSQAEAKRLPEGYSSQAGNKQ